LLAVLLAATAAVARPAAAQDADPRWQPWVGCWEPSDAEMAADDSVPPEPSLLVCVLPAAGSSAVEIATVAGGQVVERERVDVTGEQRASERDGCTGWDSAEWSPDGLQAYLTSEHMCAGDVVRRSSGIIAIAPTGEWLDIRGLSAGGRTGVRVVRYRPVWPLPSDVPAEIARALPQRTLAIEAARSAAGGWLTPAHVIEVSRRVDERVLAAWLVERRYGFAASARDLEEMADAGVPGSVTDLIVALSNPHRFRVDRPSQEVALRPDEPLERYDYGRGRYAHGSIFWDPFYYSPFGYRGRAGYYDRYYGGYGYRYGGYGYGWYPGDRVVVVVPGPQPPERTHGRVVKGRGYSEGPRPASSTGRRSTGSGSSTSNSSASGSSSGDASTSGSGSSSESTRTAKPRS
jgi:hypothetical protein